MKKPVFAAALLGALAIAAVAAPHSGLKPGEQVTPFHPKHLAGPLAGTSNCFPCTFQNRPQVQVWVNGDQPQNVASIAKTLREAMETHKNKDLKTLVVFLIDAKNAGVVQQSVAAAAKNPALAGVGMALLNKSDAAVGAYRINTSPEVKNTVLVYRDWTVASTLVNLKADAAGQRQLQSAIAGVTR